MSNTSSTTSTNERVIGPEIPQENSTENSTKRPLDAYERYQ